MADDENVKYNGEAMSLTALAKLLSGKKYARKKYAIACPRYFKYKGNGLTISGAVWVCEFGVLSPTLNNLTTA